MSPKKEKMAKKPIVLPSLPPRAKQNMITKEDIDVYQELSQFEQQMTKKEQEMIKPESTQRPSAHSKKTTSSASPSLLSAVYGSTDHASESYSEETLPSEKNFHFYQVILL
jgi:hypothetical protein